MEGLDNWQQLADKRPVSRKATPSFGRRLICGRPAARWQPRDRLRPPDRWQHWRQIYDRCILTRKRSAARLRKMSSSSLPAPSVYNFKTFHVNFFFLQKSCSLLILSVLWRGSWRRWAAAEFERWKTNRWNSADLLNGGNAKLHQATTGQQQNLLFRRIPTPRVLNGGIPPTT